MSYRIEDCLPLMSKMYIARILNSFLKQEFPRQDEDRMRSHIQQNRQELADRDHVTTRLQKLQSRNRSTRILVEELLVSLLEHPEMACGEEELCKRVRQQEQQVLDDSERGADALFADERAVETYREVLREALGDNDISPREFAMLKTLREKLGLSRREHRLLEAWLGKFPRSNNQLHAYSDFTEVVKALQGEGILFYCNRADEQPLLVLPEEIAASVKPALDFDMTAAAQRLLQDQLTHEQLYRALQAQGLPVSGSKSERSERLIQATCKPREVLDAFQNTELAELCRQFEGIKVTGSKEERRDRLIEAFASLPTEPEPDPSADPRATAYQHLDDLAQRHAQKLRQLNVIKKDREVERKFERGTRYLFEHVLGCELLEEPGTDHADGALRLPDGQLMLWDNKSREKEPYRFPKDHVDQFRGYIADYHKGGERVSVFLVIVPEVNEEDAAIQASRLKNSTDSDTDVAVITARDLKYVAENWPEHARGDRFNPKVFNMTGVLDRAKLDAAMESLL
jgi:hypothetical protein